MPKGRGTKAVLTLAPNPVAENSPYAVSGTGFRADTVVSVGIREKEVTYWSTIWADAAGRFSFPWSSNRMLAGERVEHEAYQPKGKAYSLVAKAILSVVA